MKMHLGLAAAASLALSVGSLANAQNYTQVNLVANTSGIAPATDSHLVNPWGLVRSSGSPWWVSDAGSGYSTVYEGAGTIIPLVVTIPKSNPAGPFKGGTPTGIIFNGNPADFLLAPGDPALFIYCTLDGTITGWPSATKTAIAEYKATDGSSYTGLTVATLNGTTLLYAANFSKGRIDVFSTHFHVVTLPPVPNGDTFNPGTEAPFFDGLLPAHYVPFNVQATGNNLVVTYALDDFSAGPGLGYMDIFTTSGELVQRLQRTLWTNAPWGVTLAPDDFGTYSHDLLIGQFGGGGTTQGAGTISAYNPVTGKFIGLIEDSTGKPITINGLWAISFANGAPKNGKAGTVSVNYDPDAAPAAEMYFTAGPNNQKDGLFGYLKPVPTELTDGSDQ